MKLPGGERVAESTAGVADLLKEYGLSFKGSINVRKHEQGMVSEGYILLADGSILAAAYYSQGIHLYQMDALDRMMPLRGVAAEVLAMTDDEIRAAIDAAPESAIKGERPADRPAAAASGPVGEYDRILSRMTSLPGVVAAALVADGLPVFQFGSAADFEHIAAATEDMVRAGSRIAAELQLGPADQIILETPVNKVIIAPVSDMFLCVLAGRDTNLGLIRLNVRDAQMTCDK